MNSHTILITLIQRLKKVSMPSTILNPKSTGQLIRYLIPACYIVIVVLVASHGYGQENKNQGYQRIKEQKATSTFWQYATNRPGGNIKGGGTIKATDIKKPFKNKSAWEKGAN